MNARPCHNHRRRCLALTALLSMSLCSGFAQSNYATPFNFSSIKLGPAANAVDGLGSAARFGAMGQIVADAAGNLYVSDTSNAAIRKLTPGGSVTTFAGKPGYASLLDGMGSEARFKTPIGITIDPAGNLYVADTSLRKITPAGLVSTVANATGAGWLARDPNGNLYIAGAGEIKKVTPEGVTSTFASKATFLGNGGAPGQGFESAQIEGLAVDGAGNLCACVNYRYSYSSGLIVTASARAFVWRKSTTNATPPSEITIYATTGTGSIPRIRGIAFDAAGALYVSEVDGFQITKCVFPNAGSSSITKVIFAGVPRVAGSSDGPGDTARFNSPGTLAFDPSGDLHVVDEDNHTLRKISPAGVVSTLAGQAGPIDAGNHGPSDPPQFIDQVYSAAVAADAAGNLYVASPYIHTIRKVTPDGACFAVAGPGLWTDRGYTASGYIDKPGAEARFLSPGGIAVTPSGTVYVADTGNDVIRKITPAGLVTTFAGTSRPFTAAFSDGLGAAAGFDDPRGLALDSLGNLYVADCGNHAIRKITPEAVVTTLAGRPSSGPVSGYSDGAGRNALFNGPTAVAIDRDGVVYVADSGNHVIRRISPTGVVTTLAGSAGIKGFSDGSGPAARFGEIVALSLDSAGNIYATDGGFDPHVSGNHLIRKISPSGIVTTLAGSPGIQGRLDGVGSGTSFDYPAAIAQYGGNLYVLDRTPGVVRVGTNNSALSNVSVRTTLAANQNLIVGFNVVGGAKPVLLRAVGPGLGPFGVGTFMADPALVLYGSSSKVAENDNWGGDTTLAATFLQVGAFGLASGSRDAALLRSISGPNTVHVSGTAGGNVLVEAYDATSSLIPRLTNLSARNFVGTGENILIAGFVINGTSPKTLLLRAVGPTLGVFGVDAALSDPKLEVYSGSTRVAENDNWASALTTVFNSAGAFALPAGSKDAAMTITLQPASYTVQVSGVNGGTGEALLEIYELP